MYHVDQMPKLVEKVKIFWLKLLKLSVMKEVSYEFNTGNGDGELRKESDCLIIYYSEEIYQRITT